MENLDEILRRNPKAAEGVASVKEAIDALNRLREAGLARGPFAAYGPYSERPNLQGIKSARKKALHRISK
jgi:hypothetical protein